MCLQPCEFLVTIRAHQLQRLPTLKYTRPLTLKQWAKMMKQGAKAEGKRKKAVKDQQHSAAAGHHFNNGAQNHKKTRSSPAGAA